MAASVLQVGTGGSGCPVGLGAAGCARDMEVELHTWGVTRLSKSRLSGVPAFSLTQEDKSHFSAP